MAQLLLQEPDDGAGTAARARPVHPADETQEHAASPDGRGADHAPRAGVLRVTPRHAAGWAPGRVARAPSRRSGLLAALLLLPLFAFLAACGSSQNNTDVRMGR